MIELLSDTALQEPEFFGVRLNPADSIEWVARGEPARRGIHLDRFVRQLQVEG